MKAGARKAREQEKPASGRINHRTVFLDETGTELEGRIPKGWERKKRVLVFLEAEVTARKESGGVLLLFLQVERTDKVK